MSGRERSRGGGLCIGVVSVSVIETHDGDAQYGRQHPSGIYFHHPCHPYHPYHLYHSFIHSSIHPFIHQSVHPFVHSPIHPFTHSPIHPFTHSSIHPFIHSHHPASSFNIPTTQAQPLTPSCHFSLSHPSPFSPSLPVALPASITVSLPSPSSFH